MTLLRAEPINHVATEVANVEIKGDPPPVTAISLKS
jgi:hypothetical protein